MTAESSSPPGDNLGRRTRRGILYTLTSTVGVNAVRIVSLPLLGRLLEPVEFGLVASGMTIVMFAQTVRDIGVGPALVQRKEITPAHVTTAVSFAVMMGLALTTIVFLSAPIVAWFYSRDELVPIVRALSVLFLLRGITSVPQALCRRELQFRAVAFIDFFSFALGTGLAIGLAVMKFGPWSLVLGYLLEASLAMFALLWVKRREMRMRFHRECLSDLLHFGIGNTLADIASYFAYNGDYMVVGNRLGAERLGFYTRAYDLMRIPSVVFSNLAGWVLFSAFSRIQDDRERLGRALRRGSFALAVVLLPASASLIVVAREVVHVVLGRGWDSAVLPFQILAGCMLARTSFRLSANVARAAGDVYLMALCNVIYAAMMIAGAIVGTHWDIVGVSISTSIACVINFVMFTHFGLRRTNVTWRMFFMLHMEALIAAACTAAASLAVATVMRRMHVPDLLLVGVTAVVSLAVLVGVAIVGYRRGQQDWVWLFETFAAKLRRKRAKP